MIYNSMSKFTLANIGAVGDSDFGPYPVGLATIPMFVGGPREGSV